MEKILNQYKENRKQYNEIIKILKDKNNTKLKEFYNNHVGAMFEKTKILKSKLNLIESLWLEDFYNEFLTLASSCINYGVIYKITNNIYYDKRTNSLHVSYFYKRKKDLLVSIINNNVIDINKNKKRYNDKNITILRNVLSKLKEINLCNINKPYVEKINKNLDIEIFPDTTTYLLFNKNRYRIEESFFISDSIYCNSDSIYYNDGLDSFILFLDNEKEILQIIEKQISNIELLYNNMIIIINKLHEYNKTHIMFEKLKQ